jgi:hypothetical protein
VELGVVGFDVAAIEEEARGLVCSHLHSSKGPVKREALRNIIMPDQAGVPHLFNQLHINVDSFAGAEVTEEPDEPLLCFCSVDIGPPDFLAVDVPGLTDLLCLSLRTSSSFEPRPFGSQAYRSTVPCTYICRRRGEAA